MFDSALPEPRTGPVTQKALNKSDEWMDECMNE